MTTVKTILSGMYPRSEQLVQMSQAYDRKRINISELEQQYNMDKAALLHYQEKNNFDFISDGLLNWQDLFRPLLESSSGVKIGPLMRYFNTNTFYRQPIIDGTLKLNNATLQHFIPAAVENFQTTISLPGLISLKEMSIGKNNSFENISCLIESIITEQCNSNIKYIQLQEPWLSYNSRWLDEKSLKTYQRQYELFFDKISNANNIKLGIHLPFGDAAPVIKMIMNLKIDYIGIDFFATEINELRDHDWSNKCLIAGCVNGRNSLVENKNIITEFATGVIDSLKPKNLYLSNNVDLSFVPEEIASKKLSVLCEVIKQF